MAVSARLIRRRIRSVANTRKITKAMELVAAAKMRKAVQGAVAARPYASAISRIVDDIREHVHNLRHPLLATREARSVLVIVAASDRGLCGAFNAAIMKKALAVLRDRPEAEKRVVTVGRRAEAAMRRAGYPIAAAFESLSQSLSFTGARAVGDFVQAEFIAGRADRVILVSTEYRSAISYVPTTSVLLPMASEDVLATIDAAVKMQYQDVMEEEHDREVDADESEKESRYEQKEYMDDLEKIDVFEPESTLLFEPNAQTVLDSLLPRLLEATVYQSLLESSASEHSSRMMAMRNATDNASDMLADLTFTFNQARQATITREISEISAGKAALETTT